MHPLELVSAAPWRRVAFTTYALSLSFFEAVVLDALIRGGGRNATIFADPMGVRAALSEQGARGAGREYEVEPIACLTGAFHPKLGIFVSDSDCHLTVGSGNLTFGGWGVNLECWEHLHASFAADAFDDTVDMLEMLTADDRIRTGAHDALLSLAAEIRVRVSNAPRRGDVRVLHSVGQTIGDQIADLADGLGGATAITVASPFFDGEAQALARLGSKLGVELIHIHVHPSAPVPGLPGTNWPTKSSLELRPVIVDDPLVTDPRRLHAKVFEVVCRRGRLLMSGSANATSAGLYTGNVEASVVRIQRGTVLGWSHNPCDPPPPDLRQAEAEAADSDGSVGVLRATLDGDMLRGIVLVPQIVGAARLRCVSTAGETDLGIVVVDMQGRFVTAAPGVEAQGWNGNRLTLRLDQGEKVAEGFVSLAVASDIVRRAGVAASRLLAMLAGTETPEDVAAILTWYHEDPTRLGQSSPVTGGVSGPATERSPVFVPLDVLRGGGAGQAAGEGAAGHAGIGWERALALVRAAFAQARGPWSGVPAPHSAGGASEEVDDEEAGESEDEQARRLIRELAARQNAANALERLLDVMLASANEGRHARTAFWLSHYLADRNRPEAVVAQAWLRRTLQALRFIDAELDAGIVTAALMLFAFERSKRAPAKARRYFLERGINPTLLPIDAEAVPGFAAALPSVDLRKFAAEVCAARTAGEQVRSFINACDRQGPRDAFPLLREWGEWSRLAPALDDATRRSRLHVYDRPPRSCPICYMDLPLAKVADLREFGVASCCRVLLCTENA